MRCHMTRWDPVYALRQPASRPVGETEAYNREVWIAGRPLTAEIGTLALVGLRLEHSRKRPFLKRECIRFALAVVASSCSFKLASRFLIGYTPIV